MKSPHFDIVAYDDYSKAHSKEMIELLDKQLGKILKLECLLCGPVLFKNFDCPHKHEGDPKKRKCSQGHQLELVFKPPYVISKNEAYKAAVLKGWTHLDCDRCK